MAKTTNKAEVIIRSDGFYDFRGDTMKPFNPDRPIKPINPPIPITPPDNPVDPVNPINPNPSSNEDPENGEKKTFSWIPFVAIGAGLLLLLKKIS